MADYNSNIDLLPVQHHHAHIVSCMIDNNVEGPVIGVALDGTGFGTDGKIWGGEFLVADYKGFERLGHIEYLPLPGGDAAIKRPYRTAISYMVSLLGEDAVNSKLAFFDGIAIDEVELIKKQVQAGINSPSTSSTGRLFDAISALLGLRNIIDYDAQAAIELEMAAYEADDRDGNICYPFTIDMKNGINLILLKELMSAIVEDLYQGKGTSTIAARFHTTVSEMVLEMCQLISQKTGIKQVALSGGVFQNRFLQRKIISLLMSQDFTVFSHNNIPCNDGGISLGQAVVANFN
jgi:hydrogenase maturation protein HypF